MNRPVSLPAGTLRRYVAFGVAMALGSAGCRYDHSPRTELQPHVQRPETSAILISADGLNVSVMDEMLADGELPNIRRMIDQGVRAQTAVSGCPTITYAQFTSLLTGRYPGNHGIVGNQWFDRHQLRFRSYGTIATYRMVDNDFQAPTLYERLPDCVTVSIQSPIRRGATRTIDNWLSSGVLWFFGGYPDVDRLIPTRFEVIRDLANETGRWPVLIHAYHPGADEVGHHHGARSPQYQQAVRNLDRQIGRIREAVQSAGMADRTYFVLLSDHGFQHVDHHFHVPQWLRHQGLKVIDRGFDDESLEVRYRHFAPYQAVVINGGKRRAVIHLRGPGGWFDRPTAEQVNQLLETDPVSGRPGLVASPGVALAAHPVPTDGHESAVELRSMLGRSRTRRRWQNGIREYRYDRVDGDALGSWADAALRATIDEGWHDAETWLAATASSPFPDIVVQMTEMFESPRAGDIVLFADDGWDFGHGNQGGHGSITRSDMLIPMIIVGPGIAAGRTIPCARLADVAPTILHLVRGHALGPGEPDFDGTDRAPQLLHP